MFSLLSPLFFSVMGTVGFIIPLMLHLIQSKQTIKVPFSTIRFLLLAQERSSTQIKLENILLWILRTALLVFLALAFAIPLLRTEGRVGKWWGKSPHDIAIIIDGSYSMDYNLGRTTVWEKAIKTATAIVDGLGEQDKYCIFVSRDYVEPIIEQLSGDKEEGLSRLKALEFSQGSSQLAPAIMDANASLNEAEQPNRDREIHVITDMQALPWKEFEGTVGVGTSKDKDGKKEEAPKKKEKKDKKEKKKKDDEKDAEGKSVSTSAWDVSKIDQKRTTFFITLLGVDTPENLSPVEIDVEPSLLMADSPATAKVRLGFTGPPKSTSATLEIDGEEIATRSTSVGAGGSPEVRFAIPGLKAGWHALQVKLPDDNLMLDNIFYAALRVEDQFPTLCVGTRDNTLFLRTALKAGQGGGIEADWIEASAINADKLSKYSCVFLCNALPLAAGAVTALEGFVENGGLLAIFPGDNAVPPDYKALTFLPSYPATISLVSLRERKKVLHWESQRHPLLETLELGDSTLSVVIKRRLALDTMESRGVHVISHGETPFLAGRPVGRGYVLLFEVSADRTWSDFPLSPFYLPIIHQVVAFAAGVGSHPPFVWCTENLAIARYLPEATSDTVFTAPDGKKVKVRSANVGSETSLYVENLMKAGIYNIDSPTGGDPEPGLAVNMVRKESDLTSLAQDSIKDLLGVDKVKIARDEEQLLAHIKDNRIGRTFGEQLLWLVLILAVAEFVVANMLSTEAPSLTGRLGLDDSGKLPSVATVLDGE